MRSCAAMLTVQREFRRHCPAEASQEQLQMVKQDRCCDRAVGWTAPHSVECRWTCFQSST